MSEAPNALTALGPTFIVLVSLLGFLILILWTFLPFAVFGLKRRVDDLREKADLANKLLAEIAASQKQTDPAAPPQESGGRHIQFRE